MNTTPHRGDANAHVSLAESIKVVTGSTVSKPLLECGGVKQVLFAMDAGQEISDHRVPFPATVHLLDGRLSLTVDDQTMVLGPSDWVVMKPDAAHSLRAAEPCRFLLTMLRGT